MKVQKLTVYELFKDGEMHSMDFNLVKPLSWVIPDGGYCCLSFPIPQGNKCQNPTVTKFWLFVYGLFIVCRTAIFSSWMILSRKFEIFATEKRGKPAIYIYVCTDTHYIYVCGIYSCISQKKKSQKRSSALAQVGVIILNNVIWIISEFISFKFT